MVVAALAAGLERLRAHAPGVLVGEDAEAVHQARVATRRMRSDLRTFRPLVDRAWADSIREELRWLAGLLGEVRDTDVLLARLQVQAAELEDGDRAASAVLLGRLEDQRATRRAVLVAALEGDRYREIVHVLEKAIAAPLLTPEADRPAIETLPRLVAAPWGRLRKAVSELSAEPSDDELHAVRIGAKKTRYATEAAEAVCGKPARRLARALAGVQAVLGDLQDAVVAEEWLRAAPAGKGRDAIVAGQLVAGQRRAAAKARASFPRAWKAASKKSLRSWLS